MQPGALTKVASGGELSRVSLAIQVAASDQAQTPTLIFDEVDAGVGGGTADIVGEKLRSLAATSQVLCVTHLPQVASKGHQQIRVSKLSDGKNTRTRIASLTSKERVEELARMLGGLEITDRTRDHAAEMLATGNT
jgi:DNA repair protein RecN (Recombination protein N)